MYNFAKTRVEVAFPKRSIRSFYLLVYLQILVFNLLANQVNTSLLSSTKYLIDNKITIIQMPSQSPTALSAIVDCSFIELTRIEVASRRWNICSSMWTIQKYSSIEFDKRFRAIHNRAGLLSIFLLFFHSHTANVFHYFLEISRGKHIPFFPHKKYRHFQILQSQVVRSRI